MTDRAIIRAAALSVGIYFLALGAIKLASLWMLIFGAVVVAVIIRSVADLYIAHLRLHERLAVGLAVLTIVVVVWGIGYLFGREIANQNTQLLQQLPAAWNTLQARLAASPAGKHVLAQAHHLASEAGRLLALAPRIALATASTVSTLLLVIVAGVYLALQPTRSREGVLSMFPKARRARLREVMNACGAALGGWLKAQVVSMILVGSLVGVGLWALGEPAPLALGLFAGVAQFVPIVGPIVASVPGLLIAATGGLESFLLTLVLYLMVSQLEANLITPLVQRNLASLPIVLGIFAVVGLGTFFGALGVLFATPLTLTAYTAVTMLYRQDVLQDEHATVPGERRTKPEDRRS